MEKRFFNSILIATDGSEEAAKAAKFAVNIAEKKKSNIWCVSVIDTLMAKEFSKTTGEGFDVVKSRLQDKCSDHLKEIVELGKKEKLKVKVKLLEGIPNKEIVNFAIKQKIELIVMGKTGFRGGKHHPVGSVTARVIENSSCCVLVVK